MTQPKPPFTRIRTNGTPFQWPSQSVPLKWSGEAVPSIGQRVTVTSNEAQGPGKVSGYYAQHGFLAVQVEIDHGPTVLAFGAEIEIPATYEPEAEAEPEKERST